MEWIGTKATKCGISADSTSKRNRGEGQRPGGQAARPSRGFRDNRCMYEYPRSRTTRALLSASPPQAADIAEEEAFSTNSFLLLVLLKNVYRKNKPLENSGDLDFFSRLRRMKISHAIEIIVRQVRNEGGEGSSQVSSISSFIRFSYLLHTDLFYSTCAYYIRV